MIKKQIRSLEFNIRKNVLNTSNNKKSFKKEEQIKADDNLLKKEN